MGKYSCEACKKKCKKEAIRLQDKYFHVGCFMCKECKKPLATDGFYTKDGAHYCGADYQRLFGTKCHACGKIVEGEVMTVLGKTYHQDCFRCSKCLKRFQPGEKATFANNDEHWCHSCQLQHQEQQQQQQQQQQQLQQQQHPSPVSTEVVPGFRETGGSSSATAIQIPTSPQSTYEENEKPQSPRLEVEPTKPNGFLKAEDESSPVDQQQKKSFEVAEIPKEDSTAKTQKPASNLPRVFGMPNNKFYNISYLERSNADFKRGPPGNAVVKEPAITHYHRPNNFSYTNLRRDFKSDLGIQGHGVQKEMVLMSSKRAGAQGKALAPIERDDWPGPPEPAAAYPELLRDKTPQQPKSPHADEVKQVEDEKVTKEIDELTKMTDSGAAAFILRDLKKKRAESPTLDPRNASMTPSAALETHHKLRYELPYFASPSRNLDMRQRVVQREQNRKSMNDLLFAPCNFGGVVKPGHGLSVYRPGSSFDARNGYQSDGGSEIEPRSKSSAGILNSYSFDVYDDRSFGDVDPTTGLRHSSHLRSTLPHGLSGRFLLENINLSSPGSKHSESPKIYPYDQLAQKNFENLIGVNKDSLERHLSKDEFETVFQMSQLEFYRLPVWQRNEAKLKVGLM